MEVAWAVMPHYALSTALARRLPGASGPELVAQLALATMTKYVKACLILVALFGKCNPALYKTCCTRLRHRHNFLGVGGDLRCEVAPWASCSLSFWGLGRSHRTSEAVKVRLTRHAEKSSYGSLSVGGS